ncbi:putative mfs multidrug protein [Neofusicoccum parvum]|uniref:Mfs multidrug protein n=2 Tax=Neofusicoccum parvum TaxID=310453 RepID=A0ACB5SL63_9PEZI|nr:putative mfs multidrug protein [Neofusicoccum parvum]
MEESRETSTRSSKTSLPLPCDDEEKQQQDATSTSSSHSNDADPNIVDWDGPNDPENPMNWTDKKKWTNIALLSIITLVTPLASSMLGPGVPVILADFNVTSNLLASFVMSIYVLGFALGPMVIAPLSEMYGRVPLYHVGNVGFLITTLACALSNSMGMLMAFRLLGGIFGSAALTIGGGSVADLMPRERRGGAMAIWAMGPLMGPVIGPVGGGFLIEAAGWRWVFWLLTIAGGVVTIVCFIFLRETYAPIVLSQKVARLRKETGNQALRSALAPDASITPRALFMHSILRPVQMLCRSPIVFLMAMYAAIIYGLMYLLFTTFTFVFEGAYGFGSGTVGLTFLGIGVGMFFGVVYTGIMSDRVIKQAIARGEELKPEHRLPLWLVLPPAILLPIGLFVYGWTTHYAEHVHWIVPIIGTGFFGFGLISLMSCNQTYLVDAFTSHAASVMAAVTLMRSLFGAFLPLAGLDMYDALGLGWGNSLLAFIALAMIPVPIVFSLFGERIRNSGAGKLEL